MEEQKTVQQEDTDEKGVPFSNRLKEVERKLQEKYDRELAQMRAEMQEKMGSVQEQPKEDLTKAELMELVRNPKGYIQNAYREVEFQREIPAAETWIKSQSGYTNDDDARVFQIIKENKLDTPYHTPMERAKTAWRLLNAEKREKQASGEQDERRRHEAISKSSTEGTGKATPKTNPVTRNDILRKLAESEKNGDLDASIRYTSMLEDIRQ